jgi:hypothetical protein
MSTTTPPAPNTIQARAGTVGPTFAKTLRTLRDTGAPPPTRPSEERAPAPRPGAYSAPASRPQPPEARAPAIPDPPEVAK